MNIPAGEIFRLREQLTFSKEGVQSLTFAKTSDYMIMLFAIDKGQTLPPHPAPGEAIVFALEGKGLLNYNGEESIIEKGENVIFAKGVEHWLEALEPLKIAVLIWLS